MRLVEVRDLDGPNLFALYPTIKVEIVVGADEIVPAVALAATSDVLDMPVPAVPLHGLARVITRLHALAGLPGPAVAHRRLDLPDHHAVTYPWQGRSCAMLIAELAVRGVTAGLDADPTPALRAALERDREQGDAPIWVRDAERRMPAVGITGTNGKTSTTRLIAHIARLAGKSVGWCSSTGVYINAERVLEGDYTGPTGARRVLTDPSIELAVLETARGGILLRGVAYESNDVGVMLNVSGDHLSLQGVETLETLAEVKSVVVRVTRPNGQVVLNADDPLVLAQRGRVRAPVTLFSRRPASDAIREHLATGGTAVTCDGTSILVVRDGETIVVAPLSDVPITFGGMAGHMVENALAATGAALGLGYSLDQIVAGLKSFKPNVRSNPGRLNVFRLNGRTIVVDYAHNESGLEALLDFASRLVCRNGRVMAIIGTAGDRQDSVFVNLGRMAGQRADRIYLKANPKYLRGRPADEPMALMRDGVGQAGAPEKLGGAYHGELGALRAALEDSTEGDAIAVMCVEEQLAILRELRERGAEEWH